MGPVHDLPCIITVLREDAGAVGKPVRVHDGQAFLKILHTLDGRHRPEDLAVTDAHTGFHMIEDRGAHEVTVLKAGNDNIPAVKDQLGPLLNPFVDPVDNGRLMLRRDHGAQFRVRMVGAAHLARLGKFHEVRDELVGAGLFDAERRQGHAAHPRAAERRVDDPQRRPLQGGIAQDQAVILRLAEGLDPFPVGRGGGVDMKTHRCGAHIGDSPDIGVLQEKFRLVAAAGDEVDTPWGIPASMRSSKTRMDVWV